MTEQEYVELSNLADKITLKSIMSLSTLFADAYMNKRYSLIALFVTNLYLNYIDNNDNELNEDKLNLIESQINTVLKLGFKNGSKSYDKLSNEKVLHQVELLLNRLLGKEE